MYICRNLDESLGRKNCKKLDVIPSLDDTFVGGWGGFSILFPLLIKYIDLNPHSAHKGHNCNCHQPFHVIPLGPMDLEFLLLFWGKWAQFIVNQ